MRIDSHQHFWKYNPRRDTWITDDMRVLKRDFLPGDLAPVLSQFSIDGCVAVQADQSEEETLFLISCAEEFSFIKGIVGWVDLRSSSVKERLEYLKESPVVKGFRHIVQSEPPGFLADPKFVQGVKLLAESGYTYDLLIYHHQLEEATEFLTRVPEVKIVIDHVAKPSISSGEIKHWAAGITAMAEFPNTYCKLSGMVTEANWQGWTRDDLYPYLDVVMEKFGPSRLMYGSDWPVCLVAASYGDQLNVVESYIEQLSTAERDAIMGENAINFYQL